MAMRGIQEYIARDANNIALDEKEPSNTIIIIYIVLSQWALYVGTTSKFSLEQRHDLISTTF